MFTTAKVELYFENLSSSTFHKLHEVSFQNADKCQREASMKNEKLSSSTVQGNFIKFHFTMQTNVSGTP